MPEENGTLVEAIEQLELAAATLEDAVNADPNAELKAEIKKTLHSLQEVIDRLNSQISET